MIMSLSDRTHTSRRRFVISGISLFVSGVGASLLSGCGDDKSTMQQIENAPDMTKKAADSLNYYKQKKPSTKGKK
jgi:hypothetical protein